ncbi:hypothetical protein JCM11641_008114 [Rhodosporidiobolus odoratus]
MNTTTSETNSRPTLRIAVGSAGTAVGIQQFERIGDETASAGAATPTVFKEMLGDPEDPIPTLAQLENFGLFDLSKSQRLLAEYRSAHPSPVSPAGSGSFPNSPVSESVPEPLRRPSEPQHRHSLAALPPQAQIVISSPSPTSPSSPRPNPFALIRKATLRPRPSQPAKSIGDVQAAPPPPTSSLGDVQPFFTSAAAQETATPRPSTALSRNETIKENRAPRKLRKAVPPKISVKTDDDFLLRPSYTLSPSSSGQIEELAPSRPAPLRQSSWRSSASSSMAISPVSYAFSSTSSPRPPSPINAFPVGISREKPLPPVDVKMRGSTTSSGDDYLADNERARFSPRSSKGRFSISSPTSPTGSSSTIWAKLKLGKRSGSRPSSIASSGTSSTWELVEGAAAAEGQRGFEVLGRHSSRPTVERSMSEAVIETPPQPTRSLADLSEITASASSPNLSRILERPEASSKRSSIMFRPRPSASSDSLRPASGTTTPAAGSAASSMTIRDPAAGGLPRSPPASNLHLAGLAPSSHLRSPPISPLSPITMSHAQSSPPVHADPSSSSVSLTTSWQSSPSSQSCDSLFHSGDETPASSADMDDTGASSAQEEEEEEEEDQEGASRRKALPDALDGLVIGDQDGQVDVQALGRV